MKNIYLSLKPIYILLFIILLIPFQKISAAWSKWPSNPIISNQNLASWSINDYLNPHVIKEDNFYKIWFTGYKNSRWNIGFVKSTTGINNFIPETNPVLSASGDWEKDINFSFVIHENLKYKMWYNSGQINWQSGPDRFRLGYAISDDEIGWTKSILSFDKPNQNLWDIGGIDRGFSIIHYNNTYHLWYTGTDLTDLNYGNFWRIGYATSPDGINWTRQNNGNPVIVPTKSWELKDVSYPHVLYENGVFKMWYGASNIGIPTQFVYATSTDGIHWNKEYENPVMTTTAGSFDSNMISSPFVIHDGNIWKMWYSGHNGSKWSIGYATNTDEPKALPSSTTPTPTPLEPIIIVPGMMASWNKEGILERQVNPTTDWKLLPFVKEYDGLVQTLKNLGYQEGKNLFLWPYDWRKSIDTTSQKLNAFIDATVKPNNPGSKIQLVGHSLGGLVTRAWTQTNSNVNQVHRLVTVATPHKGAIQPYKAWEGGDVAQENSFLSLATKIMIELNRRILPTTRQVVQNQFPVLKDLLPTESYLMSQGSNVLINEANMKVRNTWLSTLNANALPIFPTLDTIKGVGFSQTPYTYTIVAQTWLDKVLGNWQDGKVVSETGADGDTMVTAERANLDDPSVFISQNHSNAIASFDGIKQILEKLEIQAKDTDIISGQTTTIQPGLLFLLRSPATLQVIYNGQTYNDFDGIIFIPGATGGTYGATVTGTGSGAYRLAVGQFSENSYTWKEYVGNTTPGKKTLYSISYPPTAPLEDPALNLTDLQRLEEIDVQLADIAKLSLNLSIPKARFNLKTAITALSKKDYYTVKKQLEQILLDLSSLRTSITPEEVRLKSFTVSDTLIDAYQAILSKKIYVIDLSTLNRLQTLCTNENIRINGILETKSNTSENISLKTQLFTEGRAYKARAEKTTSAEIAKKYILLFQTQLLFREIRL